MRKRTISASVRANVLAVEDVQASPVGMQVGLYSLGQPLAGKAAGPAGKALLGEGPRNFGTLLPEKSCDLCAKGGARLPWRHHIWRSPVVDNSRADKAIRVLLADNHAVLVDALRVLIEKHRDLKVVGSATDGADAVHLAAKMRPDVVIVAINVPGIDGIEACRQIRKLAPSTHVLILSTYASAEYVYEAFRAGADGFVIKEASAAELIEALRRVGKGNRYMSESISNVLISDISGEHAPKDPAHNLTRRERDVLRLTAAGKSSAAAAQTLGLSPKTVESYRSRIMRKLEIHDVPGLVKFAIRHGLASLE